MGYIPREIKNITDTTKSQFSIREQNSTEANIADMIKFTESLDNEVPMTNK